MTSNQQISNSIWKGKKSKDLREKPDSGMRSKRPNTSGREEPSRASTWMFEGGQTDLDLNYFLKRKASITCLFQFKRIQMFRKSRHKQRKPFNKSNIFN